MTSRQLSLGLFAYPNGHHIAAWRDPAVPPSAATDFGYYLHLAELAEAAKLDFIFMADGNGTEVDDLATLSRIANRFVAQLEPVAMLSALAARTRHIGLVGTASTTYNEPYHVARRFASLDHLSAGRAGWNIVTSSTDAEAWNFGLDRHPDHSGRYERAGEFADVVKGLWQSWDKDAFVYDKEQARVFDPEKLNVLNHEGPHFRVRGPLNVPRTPQGRPLLFQAGSSETGKDFAARHADVVFSAQSDIEAARAFYSDVKARVSQAGRDPDGVLVLLGVMPVVGRTREEAQAKLAALNDLIHPDLARREAQRALAGLDLSGYPLDGPMPEFVPETNGNKSRLKLMLEIARKDRLTLRELGVRFATARGHLQLVGTATEIADELQHWFETGAADGFNLMPATLPGGFEDFVEQVLPELRRRGLVREGYSGERLRDHLGLPETDL